MTALYLALSCLFVNGTHGYLLWSQRATRQWSISVHAARTAGTYAFYVVGHLLGGLFFLLFAYQLFVTTYQVVWLFTLACVTVAFEYAQAMLPAAGKTELGHTIAAYVMWSLFISTGVLALFVLPASLNRQLIAGLFMGATLAIFIYAHFNHKKLYIQQMAMVGFFYAGLFALAIH